MLWYGITLGLRIHLVWASYLQNIAVIAAIVKLQLLRMGIFIIIPNSINFTPIILVVLYLLTLNAKAIF